MTEVTVAEFSKNCNSVDEFFYFGPDEVMN